MSFVLSPDADAVRGLRTPVVGRTRQVLQTATADLHALLEGQVMPLLLSFPPTPVIACMCSPRLPRMLTTALSLLRMLTTALHFPTGGASASLLVRSPRRPHPSPRPRPSMHPLTTAPMPSFPTGTLAPAERPQWPTPARSPATSPSRTRPSRPLKQTTRAPRRCWRAPPSPPPPPPSMTLATSSHCLRCSPHGRRLHANAHHDAYAPTTTRMRSPRRPLPTGSSSTCTMTLSLSLAWPCTAHASARAGARR